jgi:hypothetical protein
MFHHADRKRKMNDAGATTEHYYKILNILGQMMVEFKREINEMRAEGASETEIESMLDELEAHYATDNAEGKLVLAVLREAARLPALPGSSVSP